MTTTRRTLARLAKEFSIPFVIAASWTAYVQSGSSFTIKTIVETFGPTFFLVAWGTGQIFRVQKQASVEDGIGALRARSEELLQQFDSIGHRVETHYLSVEAKMVDLIGSLDGHLARLHSIETSSSELLHQIESTATDVRQFSTGLDSQVSLLFMPEGGGWIGFSLLNTGDYPAFDVQVRAVELDAKKPRTPSEIEELFKVLNAQGRAHELPRHLFETHERHVPQLHPSKMFGPLMKFDMRERSTLRLNVFFSTRSYGSVQLIRMSRDADGKLVYASRLKRDNEIVEEKIPKNFPGWDGESADTLFQ